MRYYYERKTFFYIHCAKLTAFSIAFFPVVTSTFAVIRASYIRGRDEGDRGCIIPQIPQALDDTTVEHLKSGETKARSGNPANNLI